MERRHSAKITSPKTKHRPHKGRLDRSKNIVASSLDLSRMAVTSLRKELNKKLRDSLPSGATNFKLLKKMPWKRNEYEVEQLKPFDTSLSVDNIHSLGMFVQHDSHHFTRIKSSGHTVDSDDDDEGEDAEDHSNNSDIEVFNEVSESCTITEGIEEEYHETLDNKENILDISGLVDDDDKGICFCVPDHISEGVEQVWFSSFVTIAEMSKIKLSHFTFAVIIFTLICEIRSL